MLIWGGDLHKETYILTTWTLYAGTVSCSVFLSFDKSVYTSQETSHNYFGSKLKCKPYVCEVFWTCFLLPLTNRWNWYDLFKELLKIRDKYYGKVPFALIVFHSFFFFFHSPNLYSCQREEIVLSMSCSLGSHTRALLCDSETVDLHFSSTTCGMKGNFLADLPVCVTHPHVVYMQTQVPHSTVWSLLPQPAVRWEMVYN